MGIRRFGRLIRLGLIVWVLTYLFVLATQQFWPTNRAYPAPADAIICLGAGVLPGRGMARPDPASLRRALTCGELQLAGVAPVVVFTGAGGANGSAAAAMGRAAEAIGMARENALIERDAGSTIQNAAFSLPLLPGGAERIVVVSDPFHLPRSWLIFRTFGVQDVVLYAADPLTELEREGLPQRGRLWRWLLRESVAIWFNAARAAAYVAGGVVGIDSETRIGWFN